MDRPDPAPAQTNFQAQVEVRCVYAHDDVGAPGNETVAQSPPEAQQSGEMSDDFRQPNHGQSLGRPPSIQTGGRHLRPADACETGTGSLAGDRPHQSSPQLVTGGFPCDQPDAQCHHE
jgi:hypothetical protein